MNKIFLCLFLVSAPALADTEWTFPFTELEANWNSPSPWTIDATGAHYADPLNNELDWTYSTLSSGVMTIPENVTSITIEFMSGYDYYGYVMDGGSYISITATADTGALPISLVDVSDGISSFNYTSYEGSDTTLVSCVLPVQTGDDLELNFTGGIDTYGDICFADLYWILWDMIIIGHDDSRLECITWAQIKNSF